MTSQINNSKQHVLYPSIDPSFVPSSWVDWLRRGWHSVNTEEWLKGYLLAKLDADLAFVRQLASERADFRRMTQRLEREVIGDLIRAQHHLPWHTKRRKQFFVEEREGQQLILNQREHALPVSQVNSLVLMAVEQGDMEMARKRFTFAWLIPTVLCSVETHRSLPTACADFDLPYQRYQGIEGLRLIRFDGAKIDPARYSKDDLLSDLAAIQPLRPIVDGLVGLTLPTAEEEAKFTQSKTKH